MTIVSSNQKWLTAAGTLSIGVNVLLFLVKYYVGAEDDSLALIADAWHTLSDSLSSVILLICVRIAAKPADGDHPFGHGRAELLASLTIGGMLLAVGLSLLLQGAEVLIDREVPDYSVWAVGVTIVSILLKELMAQISFWVARNTNSQALRADGWHHRSDAMTSLAVLAGIYLGKYLPWLDGVMALGVAAIILYSAIKILKENIHHFLGLDVDPEWVHKAKEICNRVAQTDVDAHHMHVHDYVHHREMTLHVRLPKHLSLIEAHDLVTEMEVALTQELAVETTIHMEPYLSKAEE
ncbi:cation diffusion facilitator family transporter [Persicobacter sp. CCB-QB2]|uniref:cation diffusion facilitator family transporter n=1 Tax=Persicobacter sp. CCB-QB2 TaxID=1561025 RepID=UPI0006A9819B|nr:cation diffusion facilitator family transporter [Persicobacter sp. CCB-QB2]